MSHPREATVIPKGTVFEDRNIVAPGDVVLSDHVRLGFGVLSPGRVFGGEGVQIEGGVEAGDEVYLDRFSKLAGGVRSGGACFIGEGSAVKGRLQVDGDLDVGDNVTLESGFEARGWITIRNPIPMVVYIFLYVLQLLQAGRSDEVARVLEELEKGAEATLVVREGFLHVPATATVTADESVLPGPLQVGSHCRVLGNFRVQGDAKVGRRSEFHGAIRATGDVQLLPGSTVQGNVEATGNVMIGEGVTVWGRVLGRRVEIVHGAQVHGEVLAQEGIRFLPVPEAHMVETVRHLSEGKPQDVTRLLD